MAEALAGPGIAPALEVLGHYRGCSKNVQVAEKVRPLETFLKKWWLDEREMT